MGKKNLIVGKVAFSDDCDEISEIVEKGVQFVKLGDNFHKLDYSQFQMYQGRPYAPIELGIIYTESYLNKMSGYDIMYIKTEHYKKYRD